MPFKHNASRRHRISKMKLELTNWAEYEAGLRRRGSLTLWISPEALSSWWAPKRTTRGGQPRYSDLAIETALTLGLVFGLRLRQTEGFVSSVLKLIGLDLAVPDHTTLSRQANRERQRNGRSFVSRTRDPPRPHRQYRLADLRCRPMAGRKASNKIPSGMAQAALGAGCRQRRHHRTRHDGPGCRRRLAGGAAARLDRHADRSVHGRWRL